MKVKSVGVQLIKRASFAPGKRRMTEKEFEAVRPFLTQINPERIEAARLALVEDLTLQSIANHFGWSSRQSVSDAVRRVLIAQGRREEAAQAYGSKQSTPLGWEKVCMLAPPALITKFRKDVANALAQTLAYDSLVGLPSR